MEEVFHSGLLQPRIDWMTVEPKEEDEDLKSPKGFLVRGAKKLGHLAA